MLSIICYAIGLLITITLKDIKNRENHPRKKIAYKDIKNFLKNRTLRTLTINKLLVGVSMAIFVILWQPQLKASGVPINLLGVFLAVGSLGIFLVNRKIGWLSSKINTKPLLFISAVIPGLLFFILAFIYNSIMAVSAYLIIRIVAAIREPILSKYINKEIKSERRATTLSLISMITALVVLILNPLIGVATDKSLSYGFILLGVLCLSVEVIVPITKKIIKE